MYPPGKFEAKNLPMFVLIHGGPQDADGNHFEADWYQWDRLAATAGGWSSSRTIADPPATATSSRCNRSRTFSPVPGKDILTGVDALVKDGIADPNQSRRSAATVMAAT